MLSDMRLPACIMRYLEFKIELELRADDSIIQRANENQYSLIKFNVSAMVLVSGIQINQKRQKYSNIEIIFKIHA